MKHTREWSLAALLALGALTLALPGRAQDKKPVTPSAAKPAAKGEAKGEKKAKPKQEALASKTAKFGTIAKTDKAYASALAAKDLAGGKKLIGKTGTFKGTVAKLFEPYSGKLAILNLDEDYKSAVSAVVQKEDFGKFPVLKELVGKEVVVTGKVVDYQDKPELHLAKPDQIRVVK